MKTISLKQIAVDKSVEALTVELETGTPEGVAPSMKPGAKPCLPASVNSVSAATTWLDRFAVGKVTGFKPKLLS